MPTVGCEILRQKSLAEPSSSSGVSTPVIRGLLISSAQAVFAKPKTDAADSEPADDKISGPDDAVEMLIL